MNMIEKVARAICTAHSDDPDRFDPVWKGLNWVVYIPHAVAAISAMKEPTDGMMNALLESDHIVGYATLVDLAEQGK